MIRTRRSRSIVLRGIADRRDDPHRALELRLEELRIRSQGPNLERGIADMTRLGSRMLDVEEPAAAEKCFKEALDLAAGAHGEAHPSVGRLLVLAGKSALAQEQAERALHYLTTAAPILENALGRTHVDLGEVFNAIADANLALGELGAAEEGYRRMGRIYAAHHPPESERHAVVLALLGRVAMKQKNHARAADLFEQALAIAERAFGANDMRLKEPLGDAAEAQAAAGVLPRAEVLSRRLLEMCEAALGPGHPALLPAVWSLASVYLRAERSARGGDAGAVSCVGGGGDERDGYGDGRAEGAVVTDLVSSRFRTSRR